MMLKNMLDIVDYEDILKNSDLRKYFSTPDQVLYYFCPPDMVGQQGISKIHGIS